MSVQVSLQRVRYGELFSAHLAFVRLFPSVDPQVVPQARGKRKRLETEIAYVRLVEVRGAVLLLPDRADELAGAYLAPPRRRLSRRRAFVGAPVAPLEKLAVDSLVADQVLGHREPAAAQPALERPLPGVRLDVLLQARAEHESARAQVAPVRPLAGVDPLVVAQRRAVRERPLADVAPVQRLARVQRHVILERLVVRVGTVAQAALVQFLSGVDLTVSLQLVERRERLLARLTFVRLLACVYSKVHFQAVCSRERLEAEETRQAFSRRVLLRMVLPVLAEAFPRRKPLVAYFAGVRLFSGVQPVVYLQPVGTAKRL